jgi:serine acetyltransferase
MPEMTLDHLQALELKKTINEIKDELRDAMTSVLATEDMLMTWISEATPSIQEDLGSYVKNDPAAHGSFWLVHKAYAAFRAVASYRIARAIVEDEAAEDAMVEFLPRLLSERAKATSGAEIHPNARIGKRFVLDHGFNTVIGETCEIGDDVTILNNVVLGAMGVSGNPRGQRHPKLGNRVKIGGNAKIFGPVTIEDDVHVNAGVIVANRNIAANTRLSLISMLQVEKGQNSRSVRVFGLVPEEILVFVIYGRGLSSAEVALQICRWPAGSSAWGRSLDCSATVEIATVGADGASWRVQCPTQSDKLIKVEIAKLEASSGGHSKSPPVPSDMFEESVHLILVFPDGLRIELESEELSRAVLGIADEARHVL